MDRRQIEMGLKAEEAALVRESGGIVLAGLILGLVENYVAVFVDPGLTLAATYAIFLLVLLVRPQGILGRANR